MWLNYKYWLIKDDSKADFESTKFQILTLPKWSFACQSPLIETTETYAVLRLFWRTANPDA